MPAARLHLLDIRCVKQQEVGGDEPYLLIRKNKVWSYDGMKSGMVLSLRSIQPIPFQEEIDVALMERERIGRDDLIGSGNITADQVGRGEQQFEFRDRGAHYQLVYEVVALAATTGVPAPAATPTPPAAAPSRLGAPPVPGGFGGVPPAPSGFGGAPPAPSGFGGAPPAPSGFGGAPPAPSGFGGAPTGGLGGNKPMGLGKPMGGVGLGNGGGGIGMGGGGGMPVPLFAGQLDPTMSTSLWLALAFLVLATADGQISEAELAVYQRAIRANGLPDPTQRFTWQQMLAMTSDGTLPSLSQYIANVLPADRRDGLIPVMLQIIVADGRAGHAELAKLQQVGGWIGARVTIGIG